MGDNNVIPISRARKIKKVRIYRRSGRPVNIADEELFMADWRAFYDKATQRAKLDMMKLQRYLRFGHHMLERKYDKPVYVHNFNELRNLQVEVGFPIALGISAETMDLIGVVEDYGGKD